MVIRIRHVLALSLLGIFQISNAIENECFNQFSNSIVSSIKESSVNVELKGIPIISYDTKQAKKISLDSSIVNNNKACSGSWKSFESFVLQFDKAYKVSPSLNYKTGWNRWFINGVPVYDVLAVVKPAKLSKELDAGQSEDFQLQNQPISILNNKYACYRSNYYLSVTDTAHPSEITYLSCDTISAAFDPGSLNSNQPLTIKDIFTEKELVAKLLNTAYFKEILSKAKISPVSIKTLSDLQGKFSDGNYDDALTCAIGGLNTDYSSFAISSLNSDGTVNIKFGLTPYSGGCNFIYKELELKNLKTKFPITSLVLVNQ